MTFADCIISVVYNGQTNTYEAFQRAFEIGWISKQTRDLLLERFGLNKQILQEVA